MEDEAFEFASAFLMPPQELSPYFQGRKATLELLAALKPEWRVSMAALLYAAHREKFVSTNQFRYLMSQISSRGWRLREPPELDFAPEHPKVLPKIIQAHTEMLGYTEDDLLSFVPLHRHEFEKYYGELSTSGPKKPPLLRIVN